MGQRSHDHTIVTNLTIITNGFELEASPPIPRTARAVCHSVLLCVSHLYGIPCLFTSQGITFDEFRSFFQFLNNLEDFAIAMQMYNFASRSIGQDEFGRAVYVATGLKLTRHLVHTIFKIFDVDHDDQLSYKEFIGIMKDRLHRGGRGYKTAERFTSFKSCMKKELAGR
ncbi:unnamed protein product [Oncorhynchus mykiss]|uniref:EF-hand domain-containing protein n=1 Tax=Oncorhynchus mykiss TaxID=8022 RepID=A0A060Y7F7_ONCMY|nr:unnamed protein product [Oncorhynchus mykiss]